jgi:hypothetical protein
MNTSLLEEFLAQECTPHVRRLLADAIADTLTSHHRFEFNRFEVTIDRNSNEVVLEDVLDTSPAGVNRLSLARFAAVLSQ